MSRLCTLEISRDCNIEISRNYRWNKLIILTITSGKCKMFNGTLGTFISNNVGIAGTLSAAGITRCVDRSILIALTFWKKKNHYQFLIFKKYPSLQKIQSKTGKNTEINKQWHVKFWFNIKNMELSLIYLPV